MQVTRLSDTLFEILLEQDGNFGINNVTGHSFDINQYSVHITTLLLTLLSSCLPFI